MAILEKNSLPSLPLTQENTLIDKKRFGTIQPPLFKIFLLFLILTPAKKIRNKSGGGVFVLHEEYTGFLQKTFKTKIK